ncbi:hypothetical protein [Mycobacterium shigaense]|uniref:Uncharacterized protein n=1 Tax=Mycobacterium shigaense TaxID=722731 RepID=A0A1Z4ECI3_9MYCO|nr:hypothetical protein [Mycobacterium shigaense]MEA1122447.1 hypothetical protein [Mycobacterium shigaense]PRI17107.1 hypothetical protein B2J96_01190 [Mycobacterium shigaense]BAX90681.1 hypothetical protein MSG_00516 [Mycobacterium shigaense]
MNRVFAAGSLALGMLLATPATVAEADEIQVNGGYATLSACQTDGPYVEVAHNNNLWTHWDCRQGRDGLYYLYLTN